MISIFLFIALFAITHAQWVPSLVTDFNSLTNMLECREWGLHQSMNMLKGNNTIPNVLYNVANTDNVFNYTHDDVVNWKINCTMRSFDNTITILDNFIVEYNFTTQTMRMVSNVLMVTGPNISYNSTTGDSSLNSTLPDAPPETTNQEPTPEESTPEESTPPPPEESTPEPSSGIHPGTVVSDPWTPTGPYTLVMPLDYSRHGLPSVNGSIDYGINFIVKNATGLGMIPSGNYGRDEIIVMYRQIHTWYCIYNTSLSIKDLDTNETIINAHFWANFSMPPDFRAILAFEYTVLPV